MIIDIHAHTSSHRMEGLHTEDASIEHLEELAQEYSIDLIVLMATAFPLKKSGLSNNKLMERIEGKSLFKMFGTLDIENSYETGLVELKELASLGKIAGIKLYPGYQAFDPSHECIFPIYELAAQYNLPVMFHAGELHGCCPKEIRRSGKNLRCGSSVCQLIERRPYSSPFAMAKAFSAFPQVKFVVSHLANEDFDSLRFVMKSHHNVFTDISGQFVSSSYEDTLEYREYVVCEMRKFLDLPNGIDRIIFGTDFPIQSYSDSIWLVKELVKLAGLSDEDEARVFSKNAEFVLDKNKEVS